MKKVTSKPLIDPVYEFDSNHKAITYVETGQKIGNVIPSGCIDNDSIEFSRVLILKTEL